MQVNAYNLCDISVFYFAGNTYSDTSNALIACYLYIRFILSVAIVLTSSITGKSKCPKKLIPKSNNPDTLRLLILLRITMCHIINLQIFWIYLYKCAYIRNFFGDEFGNTFI